MPYSVIGRQTIWGHQLRWTPAGTITADPTDPDHVTVVWADRGTPNVDAPEDCIFASPSAPDYDPCDAGPGSDTNVYTSESFDGGQTWTGRTLLADGGGAFAIGMEVGASALDFVGLYGLATLLLIGSTLWAAGLALLLRSSKASNLITLPIFLLLFLTPVFVPLAALTGWLHAVATVNPFTRLLEAGRGFVAGEYVDVAWAYTVVVVMLVVFSAFALWAVRQAEEAGG